MNAVFFGVFVAVRALLWLWREGLLSSCRAWALSAGVSLAGEHRQAPGHPGSGAAVSRL